MMREDNAVQIRSAEWNGLQAVGEDSWRLLLEMFLNAQDISSKSRQTYSWALMRYFDWLSMTCRRLSGLTPADIVGYKSYLLGRSLSPLTVGAYLSALRQFYRWTEVSLFYPNIARSVKAPRSKKGFLKSPLSAEQVGELLDYLKGRSLRNYAIVNLIIRTGLRTIEVSRLDAGDIVFRRGKRVLLVWGKGMFSKDSLVILNDPAWEPIRDYLATRKGVKHGDPYSLPMERDTEERDFPPGACRISASRHSGPSDLTVMSSPHIACVIPLRHGSSGAEET